MLSISHSTELKYQCSGEGRIWKAVSDVSISTSNAVPSSLDKSMPYRFERKIILLIIEFFSFGEIEFWM